MRRVINNNESRTRNMENKTQSYDSFIRPLTFITFLSLRDGFQGQT